MTLLAVITTIDTAAEARRIACALVERGLAACVQIGAIDSVYAWQGAMHEEAEFRLLIKTTQAQYAAVEAAIRELHGYELPAIFALPVAQAYEPYAQWVEQSSSGRAAVKPAP